MSYITKSTIFHQNHLTLIWTTYFFGAYLPGGGIPPPLYIGTHLTYRVMLYVIGPIFKEEFKETKTVALERRREELQGHPRRDHGQQGG